MNHRYHTSLKICYVLNLQDRFIDKAIRDVIPASTSAYWRTKLKPEKIIGASISKDIEKNLSNIEAAYHPVNSVPLAVFNAYCRFTVRIANLFNDTGLRKVLRKNKEVIINTIEELREYISYKKASELLGITQKTLYHWRTRVKFKCDHSALLLCVKRHPNQATVSEIGVIKTFLTNPDLKHWSIHSIWALAFKIGQTKLSLNAWYHYNQILRLKSTSGKARKPERPDPIRATRVNEIWHADITVFKALNGVKYYIYTVMDNYSRFIHSWQIETIVSGEIRTETIRKAIMNAFGEAPFPDLQLITDGGPENNNVTIKNFIHSTHINHTIALKDIVQSNSMMEALYSLAKYRYLYLHKITDYDDLFRVFKAFIQEYHFLKPHYGLGIYTPSEVLNGADVSVSHKKTYTQAAVERRNFNKNVNCSMKCQ